MKVRIEKSELLDAVAWVAGAVPAKEVKPALKFLRLVPDAHNCTMTIHATDLELHAVAEVRYQDCEEAGEALVPAEKLLAVLRNLPECMVEITSGPKGVSLVGCMMGLEYELPTGDPDELPRIPEVEREWYLTLNEYGLRRLIRSTLPSAAKDGARYTMMGVRLEADKECLRAVATDGRRLAVREAAATGEGKGGCVVPRRAAELMASVPVSFSEVYWNSSSVDVRWGDNRNQYRVVSRLIEGKFPDWKAVFPKEKAATQFKMAREVFGQAIRQAAVTVDHETRRLGVITQPGKLLLQAAGTETGASRVHMSADVVGPGMAIHVNPAYLLEALKPAGEDVLVSMQSPTHPMILSSAEDGPYTVLVMPLT